MDVLPDGNCFYYSYWRSKNFNNNIDVELDIHEYGSDIAEYAKSAVKSILQSTFNQSDDLFFVKFLRGKFDVNLLDMAKISADDRFKIRRYKIFYQTKKLTLLE